MACASTRSPRRGAHTARRGDDERGPARRVGREHSARPLRDPGRHRRTRSCSSHPTWRRTSPDRPWSSTAARPRNSRSRSAPDVDDSGARRVQVVVVPGDAAQHAWRVIRRPPTRPRAECARRRAARARSPPRSARRRQSRPVPPRSPGSRRARDGRRGTPRPRGARRPRPISRPPAAVRPSRPKHAHGTLCWTARASATTKAAHATSKAHAAAKPASPRSPTTPTPTSASYAATAKVNRAASAGALDRGVESLQCAREDGRALDLAYRRGRDHRTEGRRDAESACDHTRSTHGRPSGSPRVIL